MCFKVQPAVQLSANESTGLPRVSVDLDFLEDDDILGGSPGGEGGSNGIGTNHEPCDILQQSLAEANITEQSLQEAEAELDLGSFGIPGLTQVVQTLPDASLSGAGGTAVGVGIGVGGTAAIFPGSAPNATVTPPNIQPQVMNKAISVQPFMQPVGLGNVTLQSISSIQALSNGGQSGHLGIGQIQVVGQPTVMTINQSGQPILAKAMGGYQLHQSGAEVSGAGSQAGLGASGGGLLIQSNKATLGSPALNGPAVCVSSTNSSSGGTMTAPAGLVGFSSTPLSSGIGPQTQTQGQIMQNVIIQRTPTPIQPKPPQGGAIQPKLFKQQPQPQQQSQPQPAPQALQNDAHKALGLQQLPVSAAQNVAFLTGKPGSNVVLSTQATTQGPQFQQTLFKQQAAQASGKPLSVHLLNQPSSIVIPSQTVLQGQNHQFLLPQLQAGGQILTQHPGGHIITSQGPGTQLIANQILTANQNINLGQVLTSQGHPGAAHILSGPIQLQHGQMGTPTLFQMPVSLAQSQNQTQTHTVSGHAQTVIQGMPIQNSLTMLSQVEGLSPAVSLQPALQQQPGGVPSSTGAVTMAQGQPGECVTVLGTYQYVVIGFLQVPSSGQQQPLKIQNMSPSPALTSHAAAPPVAESPQPSQSPLTLSQQIQSPHHQQQSRPPSQPQPQPQTPSRSCTPSSHPPLFIVHNQIAESPQPAAQGQPQQTPPQQAHIQVQLQPQPRPASQPAPYQQDMPPMSQSPKPPPAPPAQHQFTAPPVSVCATAVVKTQLPIQGLTSDQQHHLQIIAAQIQTLSSIAQPSPQQKQLLEKLHQVHAHPTPLSLLEHFKLLRKSQSDLFLNNTRFLRPHCRMLEQLRKHQGSALHPNYSAPFHSFEDTLHRLLPYHLYQGTANSSQDYQRVDDEFERVSCQLLKRTQAMLDKYRYLLFAESKRLGPSAEMVMIDRMFIQEEKIALNQDKVLAKERPAPAPAPASLPPAASAPPAAPSVSPFPPTKLVIKQGGGGASVSWSSSSSSSFSSSGSKAAADDDDALPQRTSKPPIKTYEARRRIGLKLKIKQDQTGFSKVVHNTALDPVHTPQPQPSSQSAPRPLSTPPPSMNGTLDHHDTAGLKHNPSSTATPSQTTCRLPLRKTYRENISPRVRPGVPGGGDESLSYPRTTPSPPRHEASTPPSERTVIASVKVEKRDREALHRVGGTFRMDQHAPGPPSPESSFARDSLLPAKRCKSDSPDMDNASFSSGSPPDDSLNEHLQCAIDSILNLQQEPSARGHHIKGGGRSHQHQSQRAGGSASSSHRSAAPPPSSASASSSLAQHPQVGGRGHNGSLVPQTQSR
uniref:BRD4 interacting chromatin remodeling complex associated protein n=1 Tax=Salarias fasciatus TaxID=181472 RepID=A0A672J053_SALFA